ncbi:MAG: AI-2E family transporter, partial [Lawsonibacter sp.]|nr:AI-2E family transporter [Lawsonibacter sp.]
QVWLQTFFEDNPEIQASVMSLYSSAATSLEQWLNSDILPNLESVSTTFQWLRTTIWPNLTGMMAGVSGVVVGFLVLVKDLLIAVIVSVYLLARKDIFAAQSKKIVYSIFRTDVADLLVGEIRSAYRIMSGFINGKLLDSLIIGIICLICCNLFQFPYPALIAVIIGVTNIIPFFGPFIGAIPCGLLIFLSSPIQAVYFAIFILVLQQFDGNILGPKILGDSTGLASFWVLFSILLFGGLFGFAGMVLGVPVFAMIYSVISRLTAYGLRSRGLPQETEDYLGKTGPFSH